MADKNKTFGVGKDDPTYRKEVNPDPEYETERMLDELTDVKVSSLRESIEDIKQMVAEREELNGEIFNDIEKMKTDMANLIFQLNPETDKLEILNLKKKLFDFEELKVQEKLNNFRDIALLKRELREREKEFRERESRAGILDELLQK